ncbi:Mannan endo-1,4-beta-mannosidase 7 [Linum perenne]
MKQLGALFLLVVIAVKAAATGEDGEFVKTKGAQLTLNGIPFYANGFNAYWLMYFAADPSPSQRQKVSTVFQEARSHGLSIARTWAFNDAQDRALQISPGVYSESTFQGLDLVVSEAKKYGIKLVLSLVNNYEQFGGKKQYANWARSQGQSISSDDDFFSNSVTKGFYKNHIKTILTRRNTITGVYYKDEPAIMAWELMNEPRCTSDPSQWITEMASYAKSIDGNHLLEVGLEGFYGKSESNKQQYNPNFQVGTDFIANNEIPEIDFATVHAYPDQWLTNSDDRSQQEFLNHWLEVHIQDAQNVLQKPVLFAEFGKSSRTASVEQRDQLYNTIYTAIYSSARAGGAAAGGMFWQLFTEGMDSFGDGYEVILSKNTSTVGIIADQSQKLNRISRMYAKLRNIQKWKRARNSTGN